MANPTWGAVLERPSEAGLSWLAGPSWIKSSLSFSNGDRVEVASLPGGGVGVRDSKDPSGPVLRFTPGEWQAFLSGLRNGEFDRFGRQPKRQGMTLQSRRIGGP